MATTPSEPPNEKPTPSRPIYQVETTGSYWGDIREAFNRISPKTDLEHIGEIPCARNSLLSGIATGFGVGVIRGMGTTVFAASHWAVGAFMVVSLGTWTLCRKNMDNERRRVQQVVEQIPKRFVKSNEDGPDEPSATPSKT